MKRVIVMVAGLLVGICSLAFAQSDEPVFMGLHWGDPPEAIENRVMSVKYAQDRNVSDWFRSLYGPHEVGDFLGDIRVDFFEEDPPITSLGNTPVSWVVYLFAEDELIGIWVQSEDGVRLRDVMEVRYGPPTSSGETDVWELDNTIVRFVPGRMSLPGQMIGNMVFESRHLWQAILDYLDQTAERRHQEYLRSLEPDAYSW